MLEIMERAFLDRLSALFPSKKEEPWRRFLELGLPSKENEHYRYVRTKDLYDMPFQAASLQNRPDLSIEPSTVVFLNGHFSEELSSIPNEMIALPLSKAYETYGTFLTSRLKILLNEETDPFAVLNGAVDQEGLFLYVPPKKICKKPLRLIHFVNQDHVLAAPRIHVFMGKDSFLDLSISQHFTSVGGWINAFFDFALEERSQVRMTMIEKGESSSWNFAAIRASLKKESRFHSVSVSTGGKTSRQDYAIHLAGEYAECSLSGVWKLTKSSQHHVNVLMVHQKPYCTSLQAFKGANHDFSKSSFEGKIYVNREAQKTEAYQRNHNLILGERAFASAKPNLEIFADDVKASHGATFGKLNEEDLFYLKTRGIDGESAKNLLIQGFFEEIIDKIMIPDVQESAKNLLKK